MLKPKLLAFVTLLGMPLLARADVDCSGVSEYSRSSNYKKDQRVWIRQGGSLGFHVFRCDKDTCFDYPEASNSGWTLVGSNLGNCK